MILELDRLEPIGRLGKPWGNKGEMLLQLTAGDPEELLRAGYLFVDIDGQRVPFPVEEIYEKGQNTLVRFAALADPQAVARLVGRAVFAPPGVAADEGDIPWDPTELLGVRVVDVEHGLLGVVEALEGNDVNPVLVIIGTLGEVMVPLADDLVVEYDAEGEVLTVRTPPGLVAMYLDA